mgnify:CR=1 FL=1
MSNYFTEKFRSLDKIPLPFLLVILFVSLVLLLNYQQGPFTNGNNSINAKEGLKCLDDIKSGSLYEDISCYQGPIFYITLYGLKEAFQQNFYYSILGLSLLIYLFLFMILYKIVKKEVDGFYFLSLILYITFIFVYGLRDFAFSELSALFWFFLGFYILFYSNDIKFKNFFSSCFFAISFLTKQSYIIPIGVSLIFYFVSALKIRIENKKFNFTFKGVYNLFLLLIPLALLILIFHLLFPNFLIYTFSLSNPSLQEQKLNIAVNLFSDSFSSVFSKIYYAFALNEDIVNTFLALILVLTLYLFIKKKSFIEVYTLSLVLINVIVHFFIGNNTIEYRRIFFIALLFIIIFLKILKESRGNLFGKGLLFFILLLLIYPAFKILYFEHEVSDLEEEFGYVMHFIPKQDNILADRDRLKFYDYESDYNTTIISQGMFGWSDPYAAPAFEKAGLVDIDIWKLEELKAEGLFYSTLAKDVAERKYDSIMFLPIGEGRSVNRLLGYIKGLSQEKNVPFKTLFPMECNLYIPTLEERCDSCDYRIRAYFLNQTHCDEIKQAMTVYYEEHFDSICKKDINAARLILNALIFNGIDLDQRCEEGGNLLDSYNNRYEITKTDILYMLLFLIIISAIYFSKKEKRGILYTQLKDGYKNNKKFLLILFLLILVMIGLYLSSKIFITCTGDYIKVENEKKCCLDLNNDKICDEEVQKEKIGECILIERDKEIPVGEILIGMICSSKQECIKKVERSNIPADYINSDSIECRKSSFITLPNFIECKTKQECLNAIENKTDLSEVIRCGKNDLCEMTELSMIGIGRFYSIKR